MISALSLLVAAVPMQTPPWSVTSTNTLSFQNRAYIPVGARVPGTIEAVEAAHAAGVQDLVVELPADGTGWQPVLASLESKGLRYFIALSTPAPRASVVVVEPENYRLPQLEGTVRTSLRITGAHQAFGILASARTANIRWHGVLEGNQGQFAFNADRDLPSEHVLVLYPEFQTGEIPDFWESFDSHRDRLLQTLRENPLGPGYRGMVNPFGKMETFMPAQALVVPTSSFFKIELAAFLRQKYGTVPLAATSWGLSVSRITTFEELTDIVPLWSESRGVPLAWNRRTNDTITVDREKSSLWDDLRQVMYSSAVRRYGRLTESVRQLTGRPVIQDWYGWVGPYENNAVALDAIGIDLDATTVVRSIDNSSRPLSTALRSRRPQAVLATNVRLAEADGPDVGNVVTATRRMGVRGWFFRCETPDQLTQVAQINRLLATDETLADWKPKALFFPETALNPATVTEVAPGTWWLPAPGAGRLLDFGEGVEGYQYEEPGNRFLALWSSTGERQPVKLKVVAPQSTQFVDLDGLPVPARVRRNELELELGPAPILLRDPEEIPIPVNSFEITTAMIDAMLFRFGSRVDVAGTVRFNVDTSIRAYERNPGAAFLDIRRQWREILVKAAPFAWIEGETSPVNTFSSVTAVPGASDGRVLTLSARIFRNDVEHVAEFPLEQRYSGPADVWFAGHIPPALLPHVRIHVGENAYPVDPVKLNFYGEGLGWYRIGQINVNTQTVRVTCPPGFPGTLLLDALVISPTPFRPNGSRPPTAWLLDSLGQEQPGR